MRKPCGNSSTSLRASKRYRWIAPRTSVAYLSIQQYKKVSQNRPCGEDQPVVEKILHQPGLWDELKILIDNQQRENRAQVERIQVHFSITQYPTNKHAAMNRSKHQLATKLNNFMYQLFSLHIDKQHTKISLQFGYQDTHLLLTIVIFPYHYTL